ncbi:hypothetical protein AUP68_14258 [Ilyonectria robusta]
MKFLHLVTFCGLASSAIIRPFNLTSDTVAQDGKHGNLSVVDYIPNPSQRFPRKLDADEGELSEGEKIQAFKAAKQAAGRRSLEVGKHYYFMNCYKAAADYVPNTDAGKWAAGEYKKLIQQEKKKNIYGCTHVGLVLGRVAKVAKDSSGCIGCGTVRTFDGTFRDVILKDFGNSGAYWHAAAPYLRFCMASNYKVGTYELSPAPHAVGNCTQTSTYRTARIGRTKATGDGQPTPDYIL